MLSGVDVFALPCRGGRLPLTLFPANCGQETLRRGTAALKRPVGNARLLKGATAERRATR